jgi:hypothetical protein
MKTRTTLLTAAIFLTIAAITTQVASQSGKDKPRPQPPAKPQEHEHEHDLTAALPGPEHELLGKYVGEFTTKSTFSTPDMPEQPPVIGSSKITSDLGGRFFLDQSSGTTMDQPYESRHYTGYNKTMKRFEAVWTWTNDTGMLNMTGASDDGGRTINWAGSFTNAQGAKQTLKAVTRHVDDDHFTLELRGEGEHAPVMITEYARKK